MNSESGIDKILKDFLKMNTFIWVLQKGADFCHGKYAACLEQEKYDTLNWALEMIISDSEKLNSMNKNEARKDLIASYEHIQHGLISVEIATSNERINEPDFLLQRKATLKSAEKLFGDAYYTATSAYSNKNLSLKDRTDALKIILFSFIMRYENWQRHWARKIGSYFQMVEVKKAIKSCNGTDFEMVIGFAGILRHLCNSDDQQQCQEALCEISEAVSVELGWWNFKTGTALHFTAATGKIEYVKALIEAGANLNAKNTDGKTALHFSVAEGKLDCVKALIEAGADMNLNANDGSSALHLAAAHCGDLAILKALIETKIQLNATDNYSRTALYLLCDLGYSGKLDFVKALIGAGAKIDVKDKKGRTALKLAAFNGQRYFLDVMIVAGADPNVKEERRRTALEEAKLSWFNRRCINYLSKMKF